MSNYHQNLFDEITGLLSSIPRANDYAAGVLLGDLRKLLREYSQADMVIFKCGPDCDDRLFWVTMEQLNDADGWIECEYCGKACQRLLSDSTWQSEEERRQENLKAF